ncbi:MAG: hypothetical protein N2484_06050 [Clostridia bacterium]|nr:hypothetical protein [Clostridia bacterium]
MWIPAVFAVYVVFLSIAVVNHEPWFDEAQAWLLARDASPFSLLSEYMRYEGSPALWHLVLMLPAKLHLPYFSLNLTAGLISAVSVYIFLHHSPFPPVVKVLYPFSFFAFYQYAVVARSYVLIPLLLFLTAMAYRNKSSHPYVFVFLLILLSNVSLHGAIIAIGIMGVHALDTLRKWSTLSSTSRIKHVYSVIAFGVMMLLLFLQLKPPADIITVAAFSKDLSHFFSGGLSIIYASISLNTVLNIKSDNMFFIFSKLLSRAAFFSSLLWFGFRKRLMIFLTPLIGLCLLFTMIYANAWHQGTVFYLWLFALWLSFEKEPKEALPPQKIMKGVMTSALVLVLAVQCYWAYSSFRFDYRYSYSASREAAKYIKENRLEGKRIFMSGFHTISILPYFSHNLFCNYNNGQSPCFWLWSGKNNVYSERYLDVGKYNPDIVILGIKNYSKEIATSQNTWVPEIPGYRFVRLFNGNLFWKDQPFEKDSFAFYERISKKQ